MQRRPLRVLSRATVLLSAALLATATPGVSTADDAPAVVGDSVAVERDLRRSIERFQDTWRKAWQKVELKRHKAINLSRIRGWVVSANGEITDPIWDGDRFQDNRTPDLRRYLAILCYVDTPTDLEIEAVKSLAKGKI